MERQVLAKWLQPEPAPFALFHRSTPAARSLFLCAIRCPHSLKHLPAALKERKETLRRLRTHPRLEQIPARRRKRTAAPAHVPAFLQNESLPDCRNRPFPSQPRHSLHPYHLAVIAERTARPLRSARYRRPTRPKRALRGRKRPLENTMEMRCPFRASYTNGRITSMGIAAVGLNSVPNSVPGTRQEERRRGSTRRYYWFFYHNEAGKPKSPLM